MLIRSQDGKKEGGLMKANLTYELTIDALGTLEVPRAFRYSLMIRYYSSNIIRSQGAISYLSPVAKHLPEIKSVPDSVTAPDTGEDE